MKQLKAAKYYNPVFAWEPRGPKQVSMKGPGNQFVKVCYMFPSAVLSICPNQPQEYNVRKH